MPDPRRLTDTDEPADYGRIVSPRSVSIVIPAYNEEACIGDSLDAVMSFAAGYPAVREIIVVDDGSTDRTPAIVEQACARYRRCRAHPELLRNPKNLGKGATVRTGLLHATGDVILFTDADLSTPMSEAPRLIEPILANECDVVIGSRAIDRSLIAVRQGRVRETAGRLFNRLVRLITRLDIRDTQCGFKAFRRSAIMPVFRLQRVRAFAFDVEILYLAARHGLKIREVPVHWSHVSHTKVSLLRDSLSMFVDLLAIRFRALRGAYKWNGRDANP